MSLDVIEVTVRSCGGTVERGASDIEIAFFSVILHEMTLRVTCEEDIDR